MTSALRTRSSRRHGGLAALVLGLGVVLAPLHALRATTASAENEPPGALSAPTAIEPTTSTTSTPAVLETTTSAIGAPGPAVKQGGLDECGQPVTEFLDLGGDGLLHELQIEREPDDECGAGAIGACEASGPSKDGDYPDCCPTARADGSSRACVRFPVASNCMGDDTSEPGTEGCMVYVRTARNCFEAGFALAGCTTLTNNLFKSCRAALESGRAQGICRQARLPLHQACAAGQVTDCVAFMKVSCTDDPAFTGCPAPQAPPISPPAVPEARQEPPTPPAPPAVDPGRNAEPDPELELRSSDADPLGTPAAEPADNAAAATGEPTGSTATEPEETPPEPPTAPSLNAFDTQEAPRSDPLFPDAPVGGTEPSSLAGLVDRFLIPEFSFDGAPNEIVGQIASDVATGRTPGLLALPLIAAAGVALALGVDRARRRSA